MAQAYLSTCTPKKARTLPARTSTARRCRPGPGQNANQFAKIKLFTIDEAFGGWEKADKEHFADGASFDLIIPGSKGQDDEPPSRPPQAKALRTHHGSASIAHYSPCLGFYANLGITKNK